MSTAKRTAANSSQKSIKNEIKNMSANNMTPQETENYKQWLRRENAKLRQQIYCVQCREKRVETLFLPCRHVVACEDCSNKMDNCITCDAAILGTARTFLV